MVQDQTGNHPLRWNRRGVVVSTEGYDQYKVRIDGSRNVTERNRKYLRVFQPFIPSDQMPITAGGRDDSAPKDMGCSSHNTPVVHGENEKVFPTPVDPSDPTGNQTANDSVT